VPAPALGKVSLCGALRRRTDARRISVATADCNPDSPTATGPCALRVDFYEALDFAGDPTGTLPFPLADFKLNNCGYFVADSIEAMEKAANK
jgi:hypothetical protein